MGTLTVTELEERVRLRSFRMLFWDFDGVIKESVSIKSDAFERLFAPFGAAVAARVREHHECNGGLSRYQKLPLYLQWAGQPGTAEQVSHYDALFSAAVRQAVIDCDWVSGAREYLNANHQSQHMVLVTATPQAEIEHIAAALGIASMFRGIHGAPLSKTDAVTASLAQAQCACEHALLIGDSAADLEAAAAAGVRFLLRRTDINVTLQRTYRGPQCENFAHE